MQTFQALMARQDGDRVTTAVETLSADDLPPGDVTIRVLYSSANFKDALALTPGSGVVRDYPVVPGSTWPARSSSHNHPTSRPATRSLRTGIRSAPVTTAATPNTLACPPTKWYACNG
ncbi:fadB4 domain protein [Mycobacterium xenopi 3993]|nr:fadB4 domain protein [Mycobacterium xenopi 3993]